MAAAAKAKPYDYLIKLLLIGDSGVGKSCLLLRFSDDSFTHNFIATIGIDFKVKTIDLDGKKIKLQIWDTAGQERFHTITTAYYRGAHGMVLVYDVCDEKTFENVRHWVKQIELHAQQNVNKVLLGNKCDMPNKVIPTEKGAQLAADYGLKFFETSAKSNLNVADAFLTITRDVKNRLSELPPPDPNGGGVHLTGQNGANGKSTPCCGGSGGAKAKSAAAAADG